MAFIDILGLSIPVENIVSFGIGRPKRYQGSDPLTVPACTVSKVDHLLHVTVPSAAASVRVRGRTYQDETMFGAPVTKVYLLNREHARVRAREGFFFKFRESDGKIRRAQTFTIRW